MRSAPSAPSGHRVNGPHGDLGTFRNAILAENGFGQSLDLEVLA